MEKCKHKNKIQISVSSDYKFGQDYIDYCPDCDQVLIGNKNSSGRNRIDRILPFGAFVNENGAYYFYGKEIDKIKKIKEI